MARKAKPIPVEDEEVFEGLEEIGEEEEELDEIEDPEEEEEEEPEEPPRRAAKKAARKVDPEDPQDVIRTVLVDGILAYIDQQVEAKVAAAMGEGEEQEEAPPRRAVKKAVQRPAKRAAATPAKKTTGKPAATSQEVREWLQTNGYEVSERGRISDAAKKFYTKKTGRRVQA
jgi:Lsr2